MWAAIQHVRVKHGGLDVFVTQQFLDDANVIAVSQAMCGKRMPEEEK
jgi:hypothetical protein